MTWTEIVGYVAATCTTVAFVPQALQIIKTKNTAGISLAMYSIFTFGLVAWLLFGIAQNSWPIIIANAVTLVFASVILVYKLRYK